VRTDSCLRVEGFDDVWAGGDCAAVPHPAGGTCPPVGIYALKHGEQIGRNLLRVRAGKEPEPFRYPGLGQGVSIGQRTAVGELKGVPIRGLLCWIVWRSMLFYFFPTWDRRLRLLADWSIWPLVGRDIVQLSRGDAGKYEIHPEVYQPGAVIAQRSRPVHLAHVIIEGEVEFVRHGDGGEEIVETYGPGEHFGRKRLERSGADDARARSLVRSVALRADQANQLREVLRVVARTGAFQPARPEERGSDG
jgi:hypothetical protein